MRSTPLEAGRLHQINIQKHHCWTAKRAWDWYHRHAIPVGFNYVPSTAVNSTECWQEATFDRPTIERELSWAEKWTYNSIRIFLPYLVWAQDRVGFMARFEWLLETAKRHRLTVVPVLFDDCAFAGLQPYLGPQNPPTPRTHNSGWTPSPGTAVQFDPAKLEQLKAYVKEVIGTFRKDRRILFWDLYNEPGNNDLGSRSLFLLDSAFDWAREIKPTQPITAGVWGATNGAALQDTLFNDIRCLEKSDIVTFHHYGNVEGSRQLVESLKTLGYPVICTEWMARVHFDCRIDNVFPYYFSESVGSFHWGLVNGKTQTHIPWGWKQEAGEPECWFHDVIRIDGTPYDAREQSIIRNREVPK